MAIQEKKYGFMQIGLICIFTPIFYLSCISAENKNGQPLQIDQNSRFVVLTGLSSNFWEDVECLVNLESKHSK